MKANHLLLQNVIDINPRTGIIKLHDKRMGLISVEALGILRNDLINTLGKERAKGFLMRYGWACGKRAAESLNEKYTWESTEELILAGPVMHMLEGIVTVETDILEIRGNHLYLTGYWKNSFEVANHIAENNMRNESICWTLIGYASGYLTETFGEPVVVYEKYCRGKGDAECYFIAETAKHCDEKYLIDQRYYQNESLQAVLEDVYSEIEQLNENIIEAEEVQNQLTELFLEDRDINDITSAISNVLRRSIVIDHYDEVYSSHFQSSEDEESYKKLKASKVVTNQQDGLFFESFLIKSNKVILGNLVVMGKQKLNHKEEMIIKRSLMVFTIQMYHQRKMTESLWNKREDFFDELLTNKVMDEKALSRQAALFGFNIDEPHRILVIKVIPPKMKERVLRFLTNKYPSFDLFLKDEYIIIITAETEEWDIGELPGNLMNDIEIQLPDAILHIGSGRQIDSIDKLRESYIDAKRICDFVQLTYPLSSRHATYKDFEGVMMFLKGTDHQELLHFYMNTIGSLVKYDEDNSGSLLITLKCYLDNNGNLQQTADDLHLSIAGLRYRIERIESLSDIDLKTGSGRFNGQLATRIYFGLKVMGN
ncbi:hypothetical protein DV702_11185 [Sporosarcina sp. PTS2304]|uniref:XylR N-terminal domain-containing protein n=1 Tax=Sporosarcina sp. PTS2304 TaxID=2283194 RepID=UPI000E0D5586|nr:XylR N-terminal domain-containing protein [Sporosarcina sp. PTS2304]AXI00238.1 hypothetical protein DV702_11185 [Sporosarcina sp. PTS2304]